MVTPLPPSSCFPSSPHRTLLRWGRVAGKPAEPRRSGRGAHLLTLRLFLFPTVHPIVLRHGRRNPLRAAHAALAPENAQPCHFRDRRRQKLRPEATHAQDLQPPHLHRAVERCPRSARGWGVGPRVSPSGCSRSWGQVGVVTCSACAERKALEWTTRRSLLQSEPLGCYT